jgi:hypothetical protein
VKGDCFSCTMTSTCRETSVARVIADYTCPLYRPVPEPIYWARVAVRSQFGEMMAAEAILNRVPELQGGDETDAIPGRKL